MHKSQILFFILLAFSVGVLVASILSVSYEVILILLIAGIGALAVFGYQKTYSKKGLLFSILFLFLIGGMARFVYADLSSNILLQFADREAGGKPVPVTVNGYVDEESFRVKEIVLPDRIVKVNEKARIITKEQSFYETGDTLSLTGAVVKNENREIKTRILFPKISNYDNLKMGFWETRILKFKKSAFSIRYSFEKAINRSVAEPNAAYINGILLGSRQNIPDDLKEDFNKTGTAHILAISGYNIMIIANALLAVLVFFVKRKSAFWISVAVILAFSIMTGSTSSVVRASLMGLLLLFAQGYGRVYNARNSIALAGALMIFVNPFVLAFDIGFQLSFLAVAGLIYLYPILRNKFEKWPSLLGAKDSFLTTISAQAFVGIPVIVYFGRFSWTFLPANILVLPLVPFAMLFGLVAGLGQILLPPLGQIISIPAWAITTYQIWVIKLLS